MTSDLLLKHQSVCVSTETEIEGQKKNTTKNPSKIINVSLIKINHLLLNGYKRNIDLLAGLNEFDAIGLFQCFESFRRNRYSSSNESGSNMSRWKFGTIITYLR
jgi:hypothetical protein